MSKIKSIPASDLGSDLLDKLSARYGVSASALSKKHVLFFDDAPNGEQNSEDTYSARVVTTAVIVDKPVEISVTAVGSAIKSPDDLYDYARGRTITFSRAVKAMGL